MVCLSSRAEAGLVRYAEAPARFAFVPHILAGKAEMITIGICEDSTFRLSTAVTSTPFMSGRLKSTTIRSGCKVAADAIALSPFSTSTVSYPMLRGQNVNKSRQGG